MKERKEWEGEDRERKKRDKHCSKLKQLLSSFNLRTPCRTWWKPYLGDFSQPGSCFGSSFHHLHHCGSPVGQEQSKGIETTGIIERKYTERKRHL